ncbi:hypothetical protein ACFSTA_00140 [Ornithinibacillus salinisoli]|uniref:Uncharacterized protein n=1 Tax=Ornithinibacillus salinisoli TaxID=1848459 RepID=A0ABW4VVX9_9BACI
MKKFILILIAVTLFGCSEKADPDQAGNTSEDQARVKFQQMDVTVEDNVATLKGEANTVNQEFYYSVHIGESQIGEEEKVTLENGANDWRDFTIQVELTDDMIKDEEIPVLHLYGKRENGEKVNPNYIPIDLHMN